MTLKKKAALRGQFYKRITDIVETPVTVTAFALESENEQLIICSCDLCAIEETLIKLVCKKIKALNIDIDVNKIIICATHTHNSYDYSDSDSDETSLNALKKFIPPETYEENLHYDEDVISSKETTEHLANCIARSALDAWNNRDTAYYANGFGRAAIGMNRRVCYNDGSAKMWGDTNLSEFTEIEGTDDSGIEIMFTYDFNKKPTGALLNIACPSQVLEHRSIVSSDYWGKVKILLRKRFGEDFKVLALCSAAGDQCPRDMIRWVHPEEPIDDPNISRLNPVEHRADPSMFDVIGTWKIGKRIANEVFDVFDETFDLKDKALLRHEYKVINLPIRKVTLKERDRAEKKLAEYIKEKGKDFNFKDCAALHVYAGTVIRYEYQQSTELRQVKLHFVRLGDIALTTNPFELFLDYGNKIRARSCAKQTFLIQLAQGCLAYLPTEKAERGSHYSAYISSGIIGHEGGDLLVRESLMAIKNLF